MLKYCLIYIVLLKCTIEGARIVPLEPRNGWNSFTKLFLNSLDDSDCGKRKKRIESEQKSLSMTESVLIVYWVRLRQVFLNK